MAGTENPLVGENVLKGQFTPCIAIQAQQGSGAVGGLLVKHLEWKKQLSGVFYDVPKTDPVGLPSAQPFPRGSKAVGAPRASAGLSWHWLSFGHSSWEGKVWDSLRFCSH